MVLTCATCLVYDDNMTDNGAAPEPIQLRKQDRELLALMAEENNPYAHVDYVPGRWHETNAEGRTRWSFERYQPAQYGFKSYVRVTAPVTRLVKLGLVDFPSDSRRCRVYLTPAGRAWLATHDAR